MSILVMRTSAMGDVALAAPVISAMRETYPGISIVILTRAQYKSFFPEDEKITFHIPDFRGRHKGLAGLFRLFRELNSQYDLTHVLDLHDVLRTKILRVLFRMRGLPVSKIDKQRKKKKSIISGKSREPLRHTVERYADVFSSAGFNFKVKAGKSISGVSLRGTGKPDPEASNVPMVIGVAPYARHTLKSWPESSMEQLMRIISERHNVKFLIFGGKEDALKAKALASRTEKAENLCGVHELKDELSLIAGLDLMIAMDSSNMHLASLSGIPTISIWGGTDPITGFGAWGQPDQHSVRIGFEELPCRPCTVFGKGKCKRGDLACMIWLTPERIYKKILDTGLLR